MQRFFVRSFTGLCFLLLVTLAVLYHRLSFLQSEDIEIEEQSASRTRWPRDLTKRWTAQRFRSYWNLSSLSSCVEPCGKKKSQALVNFTVPSKHICTPLAYCSYEHLPFHSEKYSALFLGSFATCNEDNTVSCPRYSKDECLGYSWTNKKVTLHLPWKVATKNVMELIIRSPSSFRVQTSLVSHIPNHILMIGFYFPNILYDDKCNQLYCIYSDMKRSLFEVHPAKIGDASFTYCPTPNFPTSNETMIQLAYHPGIMSIPSPLVIEAPVTHYPFVKMAICTIVKKEGRNLAEWIEFHRMMGYERFILYDNNPATKPDEAMEKIITYYKGIVIRQQWKIMHSQTEAYTDCINRYGKTTKWMTLIDVDEFMVPDPKYPTVLSVLEGVHGSDENVYVDWLAFGPCREKARGKYDLMMELCRHKTKPSSNYPKSTIRTELAAGMQNFGPHFVRMKKDIGGHVMSSFTRATLLRNFHYRFRTYPEFVERRLGPRAARARSLSMSDLNHEWEVGIKFSYSLSDEENWVLRFHEELKQRTVRVIDDLYGKSLSRGAENDV